MKPLYLGVFAAIVCVGIPQSALCQTNLPDARTDVSGEQADIQQIINRLQHIKMATLTIAESDESLIPNLSEAELKKYGCTYATRNFRHIDELLNILRQADFRVHTGYASLKLQIDLNLVGEDGRKFQILLGPSSSCLPELAGALNGHAVDANLMLPDQLIKWGRNGVVNSSYFWVTDEFPDNEISDFDILRDQSKCNLFASQFDFGDVQWKQY